MTLSEVNAERCASQDVMPLIVANHYLHRKVGASFAFALRWHGVTLGAVTFGTPPSRHMQKSVCPSDPSSVLELSRLWITDGLPPCSASRFVSSALRQMPPRLVASYADTAVGHLGVVYRALNFNYAGWTDEDRKTPRFDYVVEGKHSRDAFRCGEPYRRVRRKPKIRYWIATGSPGERRTLNSACGWAARKWDGGPYGDG
jgi:hypothetical protein